MGNNDYLIPEFEERLKKAEELKEKIDNPEPERLLSVHRQLEKEYHQLMDDKICLRCGKLEPYKNISCSNCGNKL